MLYKFTRLDGIHFSKLAAVYEESTLLTAGCRYRAMDRNAALLLAEQDFYTYLKDVFFITEGAWYAVWVDQSQYRCALRVEPYQDGLLLAGLETAPGARRMGYAKKLVMAVLKDLDRPLYSHVERQNVASMQLHRSCGFDFIRDTAVYLDGSIVNTSCTFRKMPAVR